VKHGVPQGSVLGSFLCHVCINDIMKVTNTKEEYDDDNNNKSAVILFVDGTSLIITSSNPTNFIHDISGTFTSINNWFKTNLLSLKFEKTSFMQFLTRIIHTLPLVFAAIII
jgi:hypothetical protein